MSISRWYEISGNPRLSIRAPPVSSRPAAVSANPMTPHSGQIMTATRNVRNFAAMRSLQPDQRDAGDDQQRRDDANRPQRLLQENDRDDRAEQHAGLAQC